MSEPNNNKTFLRLVGPSFDELLKILTLTIAKNTNVEKQSLPVSVYALRYAIWPMEILFKT